MFFKVCKRRILKDNADKHKVMVLGGEEGLVSEGLIDRKQLEYL